MRSIFAPLNVPLHRRLETLAVLTHILTSLLLPFYAILIPFILFFTPLCPFVLLYAAWYYYDYRTPYQGSRPSKWYRSLSVWNRFCDYFPIKLEKTAELSPEHNYIVGSHPHGILCFGIFGAFCTEGAGFSKVFPGIQPYVATLNANFYAPVRKELMMWHGLISAAKESILYNLTGDKKGNVVAIVLGGAEEALDATAENYNLTLKNRKGFVKIALTTGSHLVPLYNFGENSTYEQVVSERGSLLRKIQSGFKQLTSISPPIFHGRGVFNYAFGLLPYRVPITAVVGAPIPVEKVAEPTQEQIDELHQKYCDALTKLFDDHKTKHGIKADAKLNIL